MARTLQMLVAATVVTVVTGAAAALAATEQQVFLGALEDQPDATVRMKTGATNDFRVKVFSVHDLTVDCESGEAIVKRATIKGRIPIGDRGRFHGRNDNGDSVINVRGKVEGRQAKGLFRVTGDIEGEAGTAKDCDSGRMDWSAHAGAS